MLEYARMRGMLADLVARDPRTEEDVVLACRGTVFVLSAPSGAGKTTVTNAVLERHPHVRRCVTVTTRAAAPGEVDAVDYFFRTPAEFQHLEERGELLESALVHGHHYGTPRWWVEEQLAQGSDVLLVIDVQGARCVRERMERVVTIFLAPPSLPELEQRLRARARDADDVIATRLANAKAEIRCLPEYDYLVVNGDLELAISQVSAILTAERLRIREGAPAQEMVQTLLR